MPQSAWAEFLDEIPISQARPLTDYAIDVFRLENDFTMEFGPTCSWYWRVTLTTYPAGPLRINGGLCEGWFSGKKRAERAIYTFEWSEFKESHIWDSERCGWYKRGELPPLE